ncbi:MAG: NAD(P)H-dependent glycerol-3-phosphate dehydrogenase [Clostridia bacterium]|nr:NAD(P)H-dependent glycerol-3-phosphate dehydrogenase [Clostridia bacterium]
MAKITILGSGSWGTALAHSLCAKGHEVYLWSRKEETTLALTEKKENERYLPGVSLAGIRFTSDITVVREAEACILAVPSSAIRETAMRIAPCAFHGQAVISAAKGFDPASGKRLSETISECLPTARVSVLSGPSHAEEVALGLPTTNVIASSDIAEAQRLQALLTSQHFRIYASDDVIGVELGGALKNVIALCAGISDGKGYGDNAKAALMTRGLSEIIRLGVALGARHETFMGLSGMGDLIVTCTSMHSRNRRAGILIGKGYTAEEAEKEVGMVVEGIRAAKAAYALAKAHSVEMPITEAAYQLLCGERTVDECVHALMGRPMRNETEKYIEN